MLYCKDVKCDNCYAKRLCLNTPPLNERELSELQDKVNELKHMAAMMEIEPRLLIEALGGA